MKAITSLLLLLLLLAQVVTLSAATIPRPSLVNERISIDDFYQGHGHTTTPDGRIFVTKTDRNMNLGYWKAQVFRPENMQYDELTGRPQFDTAFSTGKSHALTGAENSLALCFHDGLNYVSV